MRARPRRVAAKPSGRPSLPRRRAFRPERVCGPRRGAEPSRASCVLPAPPLPWRGEAAAAGGGDSAPLPPDETVAVLAGLLHPVPVGAEEEDVVWPCQVPEEPFIQVPLREYDGQPQPASPGRQGEPPGTAPEAAALPAPPLPHPAFPPRARRGRAELGGGPPFRHRGLPPAAPREAGELRRGQRPRGGGCVCPRPPRRPEVPAAAGGEGGGQRRGGPWCGLRGAPGRAASDKERELLGPPGEKVDVCPPCEIRAGACWGGEVGCRG